MRGWYDTTHTSSNAEAGGVELPPAKAMCASCNRRRLVSEMTIESNPDSGAYNYLVCNEHWQQGGCFEGPQPDRIKPEKSDDIGPIPNIFY